MFYESFGWWGLLALSVISGFSQQFGSNGRGSASLRIEMFSNLVMLSTFIVSFFVSGLWGGIWFILIVISINSSITKYLVKLTFKNLIGHVPSEREEIMDEVIKETMMNVSKNKGKGASFTGIMEETKRRWDVEEGGDKNSDIPIIDREKL